MREDICRHEFYYNAFRMVKFNGIDGDYANLAVMAEKAFSMAYHECKKLMSEAFFWAFDSFQRLAGPKDAGDSHMHGFKVVCVLP